MGGRGRLYGTILVEWLWWTANYEELYFHEYWTSSEAKQSLSIYFHFYNTERLHQSLGYRTAPAVYLETSTQVEAYV